MLASPNPDTHLYACGPSGFLDFILGAANQFGWSSSCVHREYFAAAPTTSAEDQRSEEHTSELQSLMRISYAVFCLKKKKRQYTTPSQPDPTTETTETQQQKTSRIKTDD